MRRLFLFFACLGCCFAAVAQHPGDVVILFDNDVHCSAEGYPVMAGLRNQLQRKGCEVLVVSNGDFSFGGPLGAASRGEYMVRLMNVAGYDAACLGNHEFDFGLGQLRRLDSLASAPLLCCNFVGTDGSRPFLPICLRSAGGMRIAFIGVTTPSTISTSSPNNFQDSTGRYIYGFSERQLPRLVQHYVDACRNMGADFVVLLSHMGDRDGQPTSVWLLSQLSGVDAVLDGHDHHAIAQRRVGDKFSHQVLLSSTGAHFAHIGMLDLRRTRQGLRCASRLLSVDSLRQAGCIDPVVADTLAAIQSAFAARGNRVIARAEQPLVAEADGVRICRLRETNLGDFVADAYRTVLRADIGWVNGGGLRANVAAGEVTYNDLFAVNPYGNRMCLIEASGADILNALETAARLLPMAEGCFLQVSGLRFELDASVPSSVVLDANGRFDRVTGGRRVSHVTVNGEPLDSGRRYTIASTEYLLLNGGDALSFPSRRQLQCEPMSDIEVIERYVQQLGGTIGTQYARPQKRIVMK